MKFLKSALTLFGVVSTCYCYSQPDTTLPNTTKLELEFRAFQVTHYYKGRTSTSTITKPYVRINDAPSIALNKNASQLRKYLEQAPLAGRELDLMKRQRHIGGLELAGGMVGSFAFLFGGMAINGTGNKPATIFWTGFGLSLGSMVSGFVLKSMHNQQARRHLRNAFDIYNDQYYKPATGDTAVAKAPMADEVAPAFRKMNMDGVVYDEARPVNAELSANDPWGTSMIGGTLVPAQLDISSSNLSLRVEGGAYFNYKTILNISSQFNYAYLDNIGGTDDMKRGVPVGYAHATNFEVQGQYSIASWERPHANYNLKLSGNNEGKMKALAVKAFTSRVGFMMDNRVQERSNNGLPFATTTAPFVLHADRTVTTLAPDKLQYSAAMVKTDVVSVGIGYSVFKNVKLNVVDERFSGRKELTSRSDLYLDVLYAAKINVQDIIYYHDIAGSNDDIPQRLNLAATPLRKVGARIGYQYIGFAKRNVGGKCLFELNYKPGLQIDQATAALGIKVSYGLIFGGKSK